MSDGSPLQTSLGKLTSPELDLRGPTSKKKEGKGGDGKGEN